ncbi:TonB-dependent receptor [Puniceicoccaceae bacterium K14]|nr:TonB-dependent receptor [Puniceicoccaceae bacterium K14]
MQRSTKLTLLGTLVCSAAIAETDSVFTLPELNIEAQHTAIIEPISTYAAPVSRLELNPQVDLQVRNLAEAQGDITIRGGIFENTGFRLGASNILDPQTGHYSAELPIAPEMMQGPGIFVGAENALFGANSSVGTINYSFSEIIDGGKASIGFGNNDLNFQRAYTAWTFNSESDWSWGAEAEASRSESAGSIENGDHNFNRYSGRLQLLGPKSQTDLIAGYQAKFLAWPELYAAPFGSNESDNVKTTLIMLNHQQTYDENTNWEATAYYRRHADHYLFNRFSDSRAFVHETKVYGLGLSGAHRFSDSYSLNFSSQFTADEIESTNLENSFTSRNYLKLAVLPEYRLDLNNESSLSIRTGLSFDDTNRNESEFSPIADITYTKQRNSGYDKFYLAFTQATQVSGYTAIGGGTSGLFASNPNLEREISQNLELGATWQRNQSSLSAALFVRQDDDLVDWTYSTASSNARSANNVDIETFGFEAIASHSFGNFEILGSYTYLDKDEDYGLADVDASFYALNFAEHRVTAAAILSLGEIAQIRLDNEWRHQKENTVRNDDNRAFFTHFGMSFFIPEYENLELFIAIENLWDEDFEEVPGTPGRGRQYSAGANWSW